MNSLPNNKTGIDRRRFLKQSACSASLLALHKGISPLAAAADAIVAKPTSDYLRSITPSADRVAQFTEIMPPKDSAKRSNGWTFDSHLGWVHCPTIHKNGVDDSKTFYTYESDGARKLIHFADRSCRIHAYGNSFTHCDQVNDSETWEEYLAAHLQEPIRNYGVGGFSVYQAYQRMLKVESQRNAEYIILNIYEDDHFRNLDAWRSIRVGAGSNCGFTLPHLKVNMRDGICEAAGNLLSERASVGQLRNAGYRESTFANDPILRIKIATQGRQKITSTIVKTIANSFGFPEDQIPSGSPRTQIRRIHTEAALFATSKIIDWTEAFAQQNNKKLMVLLSFGRARMKQALSGQALFDQTLVDQLATKPYPVIDMRHAFAAEYQSFNGDLNSFLAPYYIGHHTPRGNFFTAWAIKDTIAKWLSPKPTPYAD